MSPNSMECLRANVMHHGSVVYVVRLMSTRWYGELVAVLDAVMVGAVRDVDFGVVLLAHGDLRLHPQVRPSALPFEIEGQHLVLIDDVLMSGRTIRAAMNELFDYGRPASVTLVCLLDLDAGELPISPDVVGATLSLEPHQRVKLSGPTPLELELQDLAL